MESAKPSSSPPPYSCAGAGGKLRKPPVPRKRPSTPYDRPPLTTGNNKSTDSQDVGGGWLSKLVVNPARRLIVGGATRILPSFFSKSDSYSVDEYDDDLHGDRDNEDIDAAAKECDDADIADHTLELGVSRWSGDAGPSNQMDKLKGSSGQQNDQEDESKNLTSDVDLAKIEDILKGKQFSRDESNRLMEILNSRLVDVSNGEEDKKTPSVISKGQAKEDKLDHEIPSMLAMGKQHDAERAVLETPMPRSQSKMQNEVGASPVDIARAYMGNRTSERGFNTYSSMSKDGREHQRSDLFPSKPYILTPSSNSKSSTCWPGAMVQDQRGFLTPQTQRGRYGLHNFPRTPYSRTIYSKTKPQLNQLQADRRSSNISLPTFQQSRTPDYSQMKSSGEVMDGGYGSVGPIRRVRNPSEPRSEGRDSQITSFSNASRSFAPVFQKNTGAAGTSHVHTTDKQEATPGGPSNETVRKILEHLDRHKPTPKEKAAELKLATEWKRPSSEDTTSMPRNILATGSELQRSGVLSDDGSFLKESGDGGVTSKGMVDQTKTLTSAAGAFGFKNTGDQTNSQDLTKKRTSQSILKPISFQRPDPQQVISSDNGRGFTFPFAATASSASEPPTPSVMPSFPATGLAESKEVPSYSFGTKKPGERLVFSFPSTSSARNPIEDGESDLKFKFGSDKKRVSFDGIVIN